MFNSFLFLYVIFLHVDLMPIIFSELAVYNKSLLPCQDNMGPVQDFFLTTTPESSGHAPSRAPPPVPSGPRPSLTSFSPSPVTRSLSSLPAETQLSPANATNLSKSQSIHSENHQELTVDDIEDFEDDEDEEEVNILRMPRWQRNDANLSLGFPSFATG